MEKPQPVYSVTVEARLPEFDSERLFVVNEKKYAHQQLEKQLSKPAPVKLARAITGGLKPQDWKHYLKALDHYWVKLGEHMEEIADGLIPLKFFVINNGDTRDSKIKIRVMIENGTVHPAKLAPERPERIDGDQHAPNWSPANPILSAFSRSNIHIRPHSIEAVFSQLDAQDSADLVHQTVYIKANEKTRFTYEVSSKKLGVTEQGFVLFV